MGPGGSWGGAEKDVVHGEEEGEDLAGSSSRPCRSCSIVSNTHEALERGGVGCAAVDFSGTAEEVEEGLSWCPFSRKPSAPDSFGAVPCTVFLLSFFLEICFSLLCFRTMEE